MENNTSILPKNDLPLTEVTLPSNGSKVFIRPYTVKEERIILKAVETTDFEQIIFAIRQIINNCVSGVDFNVDIIPQFDIEYLFLRLHGVSKNNTLTMLYKNNDCANNNGKSCDKPLSVDVDIETVNIQHIDEKTQEFVDYDAKKFGYTKRGKKIMLTQNIGVMMRFPRLTDLSLITEKSEILFKERLAQNCIEGVFDKERYIPRGEFNDQHLEEFFDSLLVPQKDILVNFISYVPVIRKTISVECQTCKYTEDVTLQGLKDFFG